MAGKKAACAKAPVHPNSRKVRQLERQTRREERMTQQGRMRHAKELLEATRFFWFREQCIALGKTDSPLSLEEARALTRIYIDRNDAELASLKSLRNPAVGRIKKIEAVKTSEEDAFRSSKGLVIPDVVDKGNVEILTEVWDGRPETHSAVPRLCVTRGDPGTEAATAVGLRERLADIAVVRARAAPITPKSALRFQAPARVRAQSVKMTLKPEEVARRCREKGADQQQRRLRTCREALLASRRGGAPPSPAANG